MRALVTTLQQSYFKEYGKICFEDMIDEKERLAEALSTAFQSRLQKIPDPWLAGRDLWRDSPFLRELLLKKIAPIGIDLLHKEGLRLLADQKLPQNGSERTTMEMLFGFQPVLLVVGVQEAVTFYHPSMPIPCKEHYLIAYGNEKSYYLQKKSDPANHLLKQQGYVFGETLRGATHPMVYFH